MSGTSLSSSPGVSFARTRCRGGGGGGDGQSGGCYMHSFLIRAATVKSSTYLSLRDSPHLPVSLYPPPTRLRGGGASLIYGL